ncbi:hypothetical protein vseg_010665 [Gypsophila vaccaria]
MLQQILAAQEKQDAKISELLAHNKMLDTQVAQLTTSNAARTTGALPPQGMQPHENINPVTLRSGAAYEGPKMPVETDVTVTKTTEPTPKPTESIVNIKVPFASRLKKNNAFYGQFRKFK